MISKRLLIFLSALGVGLAAGIVSASEAKVPDGAGAVLGGEGGVGREPGGHWRG